MKTTGRVNGIISNIVIVKADGAVGQNEICYVWTGDTMSRFLTAPAV